ncbi:MAG TPA: cysteine synthase family protein [Thermoanaerobaculia bacterium]
MTLKLSPESPSRVAADLLDSVGRTPVVELKNFARGAAHILAKLEWFNPGGSVKDRIALGMIEDAEARGLLRPGGTIVEPTSGNTGVALAMVAAVRGYRCIVVMPEGYGAVKARLMRALGAEVVRTPIEEMMSGAIGRAEQIVRETPGAFLPNQFANPVNPLTHYETTGPELAGQVGGPIDAWVAGVGTTGTFTGVARYLIDRNPRLLRVAVEPEGSILAGGPRGRHQVEGIGLSFLPPILDRSVVDEVIMIRDAEAFETCGILAREEGILAGGSSGAAAAAALRIARRLGPGKTVVTLFPDGAERYPGQGVLETSVVGS